MQRPCTEQGETMALLCLEKQLELQKTPGKEAGNAHNSQLESGNSTAVNHGANNNVGSPAHM